MAETCLLLHIPGLTPTFVGQGGRSPKHFCERCLWCTPVAQWRPNAARSWPSCSPSIRTTVQRELRENQWVDVLSRSFTLRVRINLAFLQSKKCPQPSEPRDFSTILSLSLSLVKIQLWYLVCTVVYNMSTYNTLHVYIFCRALELHNLNPSAVYFYMVTKLSSVYFYMVSEQCSWNNAPITANRHTTESTA